MSCKVTLTGAPVGGARVSVTRIIFAPRPLDLLRHVGAVAGFYDMKIIPSSVGVTDGGRFVRAELRGLRGSGSVTIEALP